MKIVRRDGRIGDKLYAVTTDTGATVKEFYFREDAFSFLDHIRKYPAVAVRVEND